MHTCNQAYPSATWSRYTDSACQTKDETQATEIVALGVCQAYSQQSDMSFNNGTKGKQIACTTQGLETTLWETSDCTGSKQVRSDAMIPGGCTESQLYASHVAIDAG